MVDVVRALTDSVRPSKYWADLKIKLIEKEGFSELSDFIGQLPMPGADGKMYRSDARLILRQRVAEYELRAALSKP